MSTPRRTLRYERAADATLAAGPDVANILAKLALTSRAAAAAYAVHAGVLPS